MSEAGTSEARELAEYGFEARSDVSDTEGGKAGPPATRSKKAASKKTDPSEVKGYDFDNPTEMHEVIAASATLVEGVRKFLNPLEEMDDPSQSDVEDGWESGEGEAITDEEDHSDEESPDEADSRPRTASCIEQHYLQNYPNMLSNHLGLFKHAKWGDEILQRAKDLRTVFHAVMLHMKWREEAEEMKKEPYRVRVSLLDRCMALQEYISEDKKVHEAVVRLFEPDFDAGFGEKIFEGATGNPAEHFATKYKTDGFSGRTPGSVGRRKTRRVSPGMLAAECKGWLRVDQERLTEGEKHLAALVEMIYKLHGNVNWPRRGRFERRICTPVARAQKEYRNAMMVAIEEKAKDHDNSLRGPQRLSQKACTVSTATLCKGMLERFYSLAWKGEKSSFWDAAKHMGLCSVYEQASDADNVKGLFDAMQSVYRVRQEILCVRLNLMTCLRRFCSKLQERLGHVLATVYATNSVSLRPKTVRGWWQHALRKLTYVSYLARYGPDHAPWVYGTVRQQELKRWNKNATGVKKLIGQKRGTELMDKYARAQEELHQLRAYKRMKLNEHALDAAAMSEAERPILGAEIPVEAAAIAAENAALVARIGALTAENAALDNVHSFEKEVQESVRYLAVDSDHEVEEEKGEEGEEEREEGGDENVTEAQLFGSDEVSDDSENSNQYSEGGEFISYNLREDRTAEDAMFWEPEHGEGTVLGLGYS